MKSVPFFFWTFLSSLALVILVLVLAFLVIPAHAQEPTFTAEISWEHPDGKDVVGYELERESGGTWAPVADTSHVAGTLAYTHLHSGISAGTYRWRVNAYNEAGGVRERSAWVVSDLHTVLPPPEAPRGLTLTIKVVVEAP